MYVLKGCGRVGVHACACHDECDRWNNWLDDSRFQSFTCFLVISAAVLAPELLHGSPVFISHLKIGLWDYRCGALHLAFPWVLGIELGSACLLG